MSSKSKIPSSRNILINKSGTLHGILDNVDYGNFAEKTIVSCCALSSVGYYWLSEVERDCL